MPSHRTPAVVLLPALLAGGACAGIASAQATFEFTNSGQALGNSDSTSVALGDLDCDGDLDAMVANYNQPNTVWTNDGNGTFTNSGQALGNGDSSSVALGDLDGDGDLDAMIGNYNTQPNTVWTNDGNGTFTNSGQELGNRNSLEVALGDLDGDGDSDAMFANAIVKEGQPNTVWINTVQGACCDEGVCIQLQTDLCSSIGGIYYGGNCGTFCPAMPAVGSCCVASGCTIITKATCTELGGSWTENGLCEECPNTCPADLNGDGAVDGQDLATVLAGWREACNE